MKLDVGCGLKPSGDINIDTLVDWNTSIDFDLKNIPNFIIADGMHLPFRYKIFNLVICDMAFEHFLDPLKALKNFTYVSDNLYIVVTNVAIIEDYKNHYYSWSRESFYNLLDVFYNDINIRIFTKNIMSIEHILIKIIKKIPLFGRLLIRIISRYIGYNIQAICKHPRIC